jgi:hypothetical protein
MTNAKKRTYEDRVQGDCQYSGKMLRIGSLPSRLSDHNRATWRIVVAILAARGKAPYEQLRDACFGHVSGDAAHPWASSFIRHCARNGWLVVARV